MEWLTPEQALAQNFKVRGSPTPQYLEFPANVDQLASQIPTPAYFDEIGIVPSPSYQWFARIGERPIIVEQEKEGVIPGGRAFIHTNISRRRTSWEIGRRCWILRNYPAQSI